MTTAVLPDRITYSDHLVRLCERAAAAAGYLAAAEEPTRAALAASARRESARLSARLDGSPLTDETADAVDAGGLPAGAPAAKPAAGGWATALKLDGMPTQEVAAVEYANLLAVADARAELAAAVTDDPLGVLARVHGLVCNRLVEPDVIARPRQTAQAVMDGGQGRVLFNAPDPGVLPERLAALAAWLRGRGGTLPALVVAGVVHERLVEWQPYEAGNGRVARALGSVLLAAGGVDRDGMAVVERHLAADPVGYYGEVAATMRRGGDPGRWLERWGEAVVGALEAAVSAVAPGAYPVPPDEAIAVVAGLPAGGRLTLPEYAARRNCAWPVAMAELDALGRVGLITPEPGTRGLRVQRTAHPAA